MSITDGIAKATDYSIDQLTLVGSSGMAVDLREVMRELNLFEDLFTNTMSGSLFMSDTQNLINNMPIIGMEYLLVTLSKPTTPWKIDKTFRVYKMTDRRKGSAQSEDYILHFCSEESFLSESQRISKSYKGMTISDMVKDICTTYLKIDGQKLPLSAITPTIGNFDIVIPYWTPFYAINWLSRMARTGQTPSCSFVFFESGESFRFAPIESLSQQEPLQSFNFLPMNFHGEKHEKSDTQIRHESAERYELKGSPDTLRSINTGAYAGKLTKIDPFAQKITVSSVNAATLFDQTDHLNENSHMQLNPDRTSVPVTEHFDSFFRVAADNLKVETWMLQRNAYLAGLHEFQITIATPGNFYLRVGQVVILNLPAGATATLEGKPMDDVFGGNYLITSIRHKIDRTKYTCVLELSKDSLSRPLPKPILSNSVMNKIRQS